MADDVDRQRYPTLAWYIDQLPEGLASYPDCKTKGSLVLSAIEGHDVSDLRDGLPEMVAATIHNPPSAGLWMHGTLSDAVSYVMVDAFYPTEEAAMQWTRERTRRTSQKKIYRAFARATGPSVLLRAAVAVHGLFQRGTDLEVERTEFGASARLTHPAYLHGGLSHRFNVPMFEEMIGQVGGRDTTASLTASEPEFATYEISWS